MNLPSTRKSRRIDFDFSASKSLHSLHKVHVEAQTLELKVSSSEKRLSVPVYSDLDAVNNEEKIAEENNLLSGDLERLNGKVPTVRSIHGVAGGRKFQRGL